MKAVSIRLCLVPAVLLAAPLHAGPRTSLNYEVATDVANAGGGRATSAGYTIDSGSGEITGISTLSSPAQTLKPGYLGQLFEVTALQLAANPATVGEGATCQLSGSQLLDDLTTIPVPAAAIGWTVVSGPLGIAASGLVTAATVPQDSGATIQGLFQGLTGSLGITVRDTIPDNFGLYAADGIGDAWQVQHFGQDNPLAAPLLDPDGDGYLNQLEYALWLDPLSGAMAGLPQAGAQGGYFTLTYQTPANPGGINYHVQIADHPAGPWSSAGVVPVGVEDHGDYRTVTVRDAEPITSHPLRLMRIKVDLP